MRNERISQQINFLSTMDHLKDVYRRTVLIFSDRKENTAEHTWHLLVAALVLREYAEVKIDLLHSLEMLIVHDIVEIDAGDVFAYDTDSHKSKYEKEAIAAKKLFGLLPRDQADYFLGLWIEFEAKETPEAKFAAAMDRFVPFVQNFISQGKTWKENPDVRKQNVLTRNTQIGEICPTLLKWLQESLDEAVQRNYIQE